MHIIKEVEALVRKSLSEENEAVSVYTERSARAKQLAEELKDSDPELSEKLNDVSYVINDIKGEEEVHIGELKELLSLLGISEENEDKGEEEAKETIIKESFISIANKLKEIL